MGAEMGRRGARTRGCRDGEAMVTPRKRVPGAQRAAVDRMVDALATTPAHAALVESCRALADHLDRLPPSTFDEKLWREYRFALHALLERVSGGSSDDFDAEFDRLRAEVGDPTQP